MTPKRDTLTKEEIVAAAGALGVEPAALAAVAEVESGPQGAFDADGFPTVLFERHVFHRLTDGRFDGLEVATPGVAYIGQANTLLSTPIPGGYGPFSMQKVKLGVAALYDREAAYKACSWGLFQIMGENHRQCGFTELDNFVEAMKSDVGKHLHALSSFLVDNAPLAALKRKDWTAFAHAYNGPATQGYDTKLAAAYARLAPLYTTT